MAIRVTEFFGQGGDLQGSLPAPRVPAIITNRVALTSTAQKVAVLDSNTRLVRILAEVNLVFEIIDNDAISTLNADGEFIAAGQDVHRCITAEVVNATGRLAVWARTA